MKEDASVVRTGALKGMAAVGTALVMAISGCGDSEAAPAPSTTVQEATPTTLELAAGSYSGEYCFVEPAHEDVCSLTVEIGQDGSLRLTADTREGRTVQMTGSVTADGAAVVRGTPGEGGGEVILTGQLVFEGDAVRIEGSWVTSSAERGTWTAAKAVERP